jgi:hypothetical protein
MMTEVAVDDQGSSCEGGRTSTRKADAHGIQRLERGSEVGDKRTNGDEDDARTKTRMKRVNGIKVARCKSVSRTLPV